MSEKSTISLATLSTEGAARDIGVSAATIRNWIKLGYLEAAAKGGVKRDSLERFKAEKIGHERLNSRANKLYKREDNPKDVKVWQSYDESLSESHRNREGIYYTPMEVVADMLSLIEGCNDIETKRILDPCCGSGNFLIRALEMGFKPQNIYGYDTDPNAVEITKRRIEEASGYRSKKIRCVDFLEVADSLRLRVDYIFTNPPWGKKIERESRKRLAAIYHAEVNSDSSVLFLRASMTLLKRGGKIGFLLQEAFFNIGSYRDIRQDLLDWKIDRFIDYGRVFGSLMTKAQAIIATNESHDDQDIICQGRDYLYARRRESFACNPCSIFNLNTTPCESEVIMRLLNTPHTTLKGRAKWGLGVVTGDNRRFCLNAPQEGFRAIYRGSDITYEGFRSSSLYIDEDLSLYQQAAPREMYEAPCKLVYKFISSRLCFLCDTEQRLILNSANFLILDDNFPISMEELAKCLNSDFMNWLFNRLFSTHKILRGNLEMLPLFPEYFDEGIFCEARYLERLNIKQSSDGSYCLSL